MQRRPGEANTPAMIVLEGLKGKAIAELCPEHQISQTPFDQWRDPCLAYASKAVEVHEQSQREARLARENARVNTLVGELPRERNNSDEVLGEADSRRPWSRRVTPRWCNAFAR